LFVIGIDMLRSWVELLKYLIMRVPFMFPIGVFTGYVYVGMAQ